MYCFPLRSVMGKAHTHAHRWKLCNHKIVYKSLATTLLSNLISLDLRAVLDTSASCRSPPAVILQGSQSVEGVEGFILCFLWPVGFFSTHYQRDFNKTDCFPHYLHAYCLRFPPWKRTFCLLAVHLCLNFRFIFQLFPRDLMCIHTILAFEYISQLCQNKDWIFPACDPKATAPEGDYSSRCFPRWSVPVGLGWVYSPGSCYRPWHWKWFPCTWDSFPIWSHEASPQMSADWNVLPDADRRQVFFSFEAFCWCHLRRGASQGIWS